MKKNQELEFICKELSNAPFYTTNIANIIRLHPRFPPKGKFKEDIYIKHAANSTLDLFFLEQEQKHPELNLNIDPINEGDKIKNYKFRYSDARRLLAIKKSEKEPYRYHTYFEFGKVVVVNGLPTLFEFKMTQYSAQGDAKGLKKSLTPYKYLKRLGILAGFFGINKINMGYVVVAPKEFFPSRVNAQEFSTWPQFRSSGGILVPYEKGLDDFRTDVSNMAVEYGFPVKDDVSIKSSPTTL